MRKLKRNRLRSQRQSTEGEKNLHREMAYLNQNPAPKNLTFRSLPTTVSTTSQIESLEEIVCNPHKTKAPQVGLEPTTLRLTAAENYCGILPDFASSCFLVLSRRKPTDLVLVSICRAVL